MHSFEQGVCYGINRIRKSKRTRPRFISPARGATRCWLHKSISWQAVGKSDDNQAKLDEMLEYARDGDTLVLTKLDRMGRSLNRILSTIEDLQKKGVSVKTLDGQVDTTSNNPMQKAMTQLLGVFAELEHSIIVDRLQSGRERTGRKGGRKRVLSPEQEKKVKKSFSNGASKSTLSQEFGVSRATIMRLVEEKY